MNDPASKTLATDAAAASPPGARAIAFEDTALVERCKKGDLRAFEALVAKYQDRVYNMIFRMVGRAAEAEDLAQETFLKAMERINQFRGASGFYTWLFRIAANLTISHRRRAGRIRFTSLGGAGDDGFENTQAEALTAAMAKRRDAGPEAAAIAAETQRRVVEALEGLDDEFRIVVVLRDIEDMDYLQIGEVLDLPAGTVKSRLHRARCMLRESLGDLV